jgi:hypothetical protein
MVDLANKQITTSAALRRVISQEKLSTAINHLTR